MVEGWNGEASDVRNDFEGTWIGQEKAWLCLKVAEFLAGGAVL